MRIAIDARKIADFGIGTYIRGLLSGLAEVEAGETFIVFAPRSARDLVPRPFEHVVVDAPHYSMRELVTVANAIRRSRADVFHAPHYVVPVTRCPTVVTIHDLIHLHQALHNPIAPLYARMMVKRAVRKSGRVLTVTEAVRRQIVRELRCDPDKVVVTPNGCDPSFRAAAPNRSPARYFLYAGNDKPHKNVARLVEAFVALSTTLSDISLVLAGSRFPQFAAIPGVITPGFVTTTELASLYRNALAVVLPSLEEGFGLPALEAMSCGAAVITSNDPALVEVTADAALHADGKSASALASAMRRVAEDDALRVTLGSRGIARAQHFTWRECARQTLRMYREASSPSP